MSDNLRHWSVLGKTDPAHTKPFKRSGGFSGIAIRPVWSEMRLTQHFGPCGIGWGMDAPTFQVIAAGDEMLVYCTLRCWYMDGDKRAELYGVGGDKIAVKRSDGRIATDDEAFKKAMTDALGNAFKHVGSSADIHMGLFEDNKYVREMRDEFADPDADHGPSPERPPARREPDLILAYPRTSGAFATATLTELKEDRERLNGAPIEQTLPAHPEETAEARARREQAFAEFFARDSYRIAPDTVGWPQWDRKVLSAFRYIAEHGTADHWHKLKADIAADFDEWGAAVVAEPVVASFRKTYDALQKQFLKRTGLG